MVKKKDYEILWVSPEFHRFFKIKTAERGEKSMKEFSRKVSINPRLLLSEKDVQIEKPSKGRKNEFKTLF